jgi:hypothetical protein
MRLFVSATRNSRASLAAAAVAAAAALEATEADAAAWIVEASGPSSSSSKVSEARGGTGTSWSGKCVPRRGTWDDRPAISAREREGRGT